jgi:cell division protein FtsL
MCSALILFSEQMDSPAFRVTATGLLIFLVLNALVNAVFTVQAIYHRRVLIVQQDPRLKKNG